jgi:parallel beta helix pectate lyase-like protein
MRKFAMWSTMAVSAFALMASLGTAQAQATRTWVSGVGDDANPCSRTAPCKTFAGAISKTASGGEISVLDPGGFGAVTIVKSITLSGDGTLAGILNAGANGVIVNAAGIKVILRHLSIHGGGTGVNGIRFLQGAELTVDRCTITGNTGAGIDVAQNATNTLNVIDTMMVGGATGINVTTTAGFAAASIQNVKIKGTSTNAISVGSSGFVSVNNSSLSSSTGTGVNALTNATVNVSNSEVTNFPTAFNSAAGSNIRILNNNIYDNTTNFVLNGTISSDGTNRVVGGGAANPNGTPIPHK